MPWLLAHYPLSPCAAGEKKKVHLSYSAGNWKPPTGTRLQRPVLPRLQEGFTPLRPAHRSPDLSQITQSVSAKPSWHLTTHGRAGGTSPPHQMARFTPAMISLHLFPPELGMMFLFTAVMRLQPKRDGSGKRRSFYISLFCLVL